jgi:hypothetical protein
VVSTKPLVDACSADSAIRRSLRQSPFSGRGSSPSAYLVAAVVIFPALQTWWATLLAVSGTCGVAVALAEFAQGKGKATEPLLIARWDGLPSVAMLRYRDDRLDRTTKARYKRLLEANISGLRFPDPSVEENNPLEADDIYQSATPWLLSHTRDKRVFALLFQQNISYGFRRNMFGLRPFAIGIAIAALLATVVATIHELLGSGHIESANLVSAVIAVTALWFWIIIVTPDWVRITANGYAFELLAACDKLNSPTSGRRVTAGNKTQSAKAKPVIEFNSKMGDRGA